MMHRYIFLVSLALLSTLAFAQSESLDPLHALPDRVDQQQRDGGANQHFIYQNASQSLPIMDDFSVDRTRNLNASATDLNVTLDQTYYQLEVGGVHLPNMEFVLDTTFHTVFDTVSVPGDTIQTITPLPMSVVTLFDLAVVPPTSIVLDGWPPYELFETVGTGTDTTHLVPDLVQDSLCVYLVAPDSRMYEQNGSFVPWILWEDDDVYINGTYPVDPPTIGVATFEGLARTGYPYDFNSTAYGIADHMTSVPIDLAYSVADSIYLSFFYQPQGLSGDDQVQPQDSLVLEFYSPSDDIWYRRWSTPYTTLRPFEQVMIPIKEIQYLQNDFQFRFLNYGSLAGALDHWHVDYVRMATNRTHNDTILVDVAYLYSESTLLDRYTSVPYAKFVQNPAAYMKDSLGVDLKNLDVNDRFISYGMGASLIHGSCTIDSDFNNGINVMNNASSTFVSTHPVKNAPNNFEYGTCPIDSCAFWEVKFHCDQTPDINLYNDTITFVQQFSNYTSYDDGSAEAGYSLNVAGGKVAYQFDSFGGDSLRAVRMYFDPIFENPSNGSFLLTVWTSLFPEIIQHQNFSFSTPEFRTDGINHFVEYPLDTTIWVNGFYYVGFVQTTATKLNLGFDKNRVNNDRIFFNVGAGFNNTGFAGSLMMRPVFVADKDPFLGITALEGPDELLLFPNPADDQLNFTTGLPDGTPVGVEVFTMLGELIQFEHNVQGNRIHVAALQNGTYYLRISDRAGDHTATKAFIIAR